MTATNARAQQTERMGTAPGFIAALDQSGGSTPKALKAYAVSYTHLTLPTIYSV